MSDEKPWYETVVMPALLRHARTVYGAAMHRALADAGCDDVPKNGLYIIGGLALGAGGVPVGQLARELGVSKQAAGQLVDTLVLRGYLERAVAADDRRKLNVTLTERGRLAASVQGTARARIDAQLLKRVGAGPIAQTRKTLAVLIEMGRATETDESEP
jgi:DNA-binding MarR family transcriptional regulator